MTLIQIWVELLISLEASLRIGTLNKLVPWMSPGLRWSLKHTSNLVQFCKEKWILRSIIVDDAVELRSRHFPCWHHLIKLGWSISIPF